MTPTATVSSPSQDDARHARADQPLVLLAGNPNSGKSTVFNTLSGSHTRVANYPGVTVDRKSARVSVNGGPPIELVDLPGTYSLSARSREEQVAVDAILGRHGRVPDAVVVVLDATALSRALYLAFEIIETGVPVIVVLNMSDEARRHGLTIDPRALAEQLGVPVVPMVATKGQGRVELLAQIGHVHRNGGPKLRTPLEAPLSEEVAELEQLIAADGGRQMSGDARRAWALWLLLSVGDDGEDELRGVSDQLRHATRQIRSRADKDGRDVDLEIISARYRQVDAVVERAVETPQTSGRSWTDRIDDVLTHRVAGSIVFAAVMIVVFQALFSWSEPAIALIEDSVAGLQQIIKDSLPPGPFTSLLVDGVIAGVGNVIVFVPQIALLFFFIGLLEDLGYLARVAFVIDRLMGSVGLHGRAFVPMLSGFSCAVPAVMATRTIESRTDRLLTMMVLPLMSCSARLPVFVLVTATVFAPSLKLWGVLSAGAVVLFAMYMLSVAAALGAAAVLRRTLLRGPRSTFLLELPPYRLPVISVLLRGMWQRVRTFLKDAGTIILALTVVLWALLSYPKSPAIEERFDTLRVAANALPEPARSEELSQLSGQQSGEELRYSVAGRAGHLVEPLLEPLGFDWRIGIGILGAFAAREVFVSTLGIVFDISEADETNEPLREALRSAERPDGARLMTPLTGVSLMVFFVLACQCMSTIAIVRRESGTWRWPIFMFLYMTALAYTASFAVYQTGRLLGWGV